MKHIHGILAGVFVFGLVAAAAAQDAGSDVAVAPGIKLQPDGVLAIGDLTAEVTHYDTDWGLTLQQNVFTASTRPATMPEAATQPSIHSIEGAFAGNSGTWNFRERVESADGAIHYSVNVSSVKQIPTNELAVLLVLPMSKYSGKELVIDQKAVKLPTEPAAAGAAGFFTGDDLHEIDIPVTGGTLAITGDISVLVQDDREWNGEQYEIRIHFSPNEGQLKASKIALDMKVKAAGK